MAFVHGDGAVAFDGKQPTQRVFSHMLQVVHATVPAITGYESGLQSPGEDVFQHVAEVVVLGFAFRLVVDTEIDGQVLPVGVRIVERDEVDALHGTVVFARPEIANEGQILTVRLVQYAVIDAQGAAFQIQEWRGLGVQVLAFVAFPLQETVRAIVRNGHHVCQTATTAIVGFAQQEADVHRQGATGCAGAGDFPDHWQAFRWLWSVCV